MSEDKKNPNENSTENSADKLMDILTDPEQEIEVLDDDKVFNVPMSGGYAKRLQALSAWLVEKKKPEEIIKSYELIGSDNDKYDVFTFHLETMLILLQEIEKQARDANAIKKVKIKDSGALI